MKPIQLWWLRYRLRLRQDARRLIRRGPQTLWEQLWWLQLKYPAVVTLVIYLFCGIVLVGTAFGMWLSQYRLN